MGRFVYFPTFLCAFVTASLATIARQAPEGSAISVVSYVANLGAAGCIPPGCEWRIVHPATGRSELLWRLPSPPLNVYWDAAFSSVHYRIGATMYQRPWSAASQPEAIVTIPSQLVVAPDAIRELIDDVWRDQQTGVWRIRTLEFRDTETTTAMWERSAAGEWTVRPSSTACDVGGAACDTGSSAAPPPDHVTLVALLNRMRVDQHLERSEPGGIWPEGAHTFPSAAAPGTAIRVGVVLGDTYHAWAPLSHVNAGGVETVIYGKVDGCSDQLAFEEVPALLLVTEEFTGACARVVDAVTGGITVTLPSTSRLAVWVPPPSSVRP